MLVTYNLPNQEASLTCELVQTAQAIVHFGLAFVK